jgi:uncharacterized protein
MNPSDEILRALLSSARTIAVVGLSAEPDRPSYEVSLYLQQQGFQIVPVNPRYPEVLGERSYANLSEIPFAIDIVNVFRKTVDVLPIAVEAIKLRPKCFWQQKGIVNQEADQLVQQSGIVGVMDLCLKVEHRRLAA